MPSPFRLHWLRQLLCQGDLIAMAGTRAVIEIRFWHASCVHGSHAADARGSRRAEPARGSTEMNEAVAFNLFVLPVRCAAAFEAAPFSNF